MKASPWTGQSPRTNPAGAGLDTLAKALDLDTRPTVLAEPVNLAEPGRLILILLHGEGSHLDRPAPARSRSPAGAGPDTRPTVLAEPVNLAEPGRLIPDPAPRRRLAPGPARARGRTRTALDRDTLAEPEPGRLILVPLHGEGLPLARPEPQGEHGPRTPRDRDTRPEPEPARLILVPLHGEGSHLARPEPQGEPGRRWT